jgi:hypothetical protein
MDKYQNTENRLSLSGQLLTELVKALELLDDERRAKLVNLSHKTLVDTAINLADLHLKTLDERRQNYQLLIDYPKYKKGERVILSCSEQEQSMQTIKEIYFDYSQEDWLYRFQSSSLIHDFYSESFLSKILD